MKPLIHGIIPVRYNSFALVYNLGTIRLPINAGVNVDAEF